MALQYRLIVTPDAKGLNDAVQAFLKEGWTPYGSPIITANTERQTAWDAHMIYAQAVTR